MSLPNASTNNNRYSLQEAYQNKQAFQQQIKSSQFDSLRIIKKFIYFFHFIFVSCFVTYILLKYPEARQITFTLIVLIIYGYMAVWTIMINFLLLTIKKQNWAVVFDRLIVKLLIMLWPICGIISYSYDTFLNIDQISYFTLYMTIVSFTLFIYEIYTCTIGEYQNPQFIFRPNDLKQSDDIVWNQRKLYNQNIVRNNLIKW